VNLTRRDFVTALSGHAIDVARAKADSRLDDIDFDAADLDRDG
jgi:hypothetical protein